MTFHVPFQVDEARPADKAKVLGIARALGMPDEVLRMLGLIPEVPRPSTVVRGKTGPKLNESHVRQIRDLHGHVTVPELVGMFNVSEQTINNIVTRRTWKNA